MKNYLLLIMILNYFSINNVAKSNPEINKTVNVTVNKAVNKTANKTETVKVNKIDIDLEEKKINKKILKLKLKIEKLRNEWDKKNDSIKFSKNKIENELIKKLSILWMEEIKNDLIKKDLFNFLILGNFSGNSNKYKYNDLLTEIRNNFKEKTKTILLILMNYKYDEKRANELAVKIIALIIQKFDILILRKQYRDEINFEYYRELNQYVKKFCKEKNYFENLICKKKIFKFIIRKLIRIHEVPLVNIKLNHQKKVFSNILNKYNTNYQTNYVNKFNLLKQEYDKNLIVIDIKIKKRLNKLNKNQNKLIQVNSNNK